MTWNFVSYFRDSFFLKKIVELGENFAHYKILPKIHKNNWSHRFFQNKKLVNPKSIFRTMASNKQLLNDILNRPHLIKKKQTITSSYGLMKEPIITTEESVPDEMLVSMACREWNGNEFAVCLYDH